MKHFNFLRTLVVGALLLLVGNVSAELKTLSLSDGVKQPDGSYVFTLQEGEYTTYGTEDMQGKTVVFEGVGIGKTIWRYGKNSSGNGEGGSDYSFDKGSNVTFKNLTLKDNYDVNSYYRGFVRPKSMHFENCEFLNMMGYFGDGNSDGVWFKDCVFNVISECEYCVKTYGGKDFYFDGCTFNAANKGFIQLYIQDNSKTHNATVNNCTFNKVEGNTTTLKTAVYWYNYNGSSEGADWNVFFSGNNVNNAGITANSTSGTWMYEWKYSNTASVYNNGVCIMDEGVAQTIKDEDIPSSVAQTTVDVAVSTDETAKGVSDETIVSAIKSVTGNTTTVNEGTEIAAEAIEGVTSTQNYLHIDVKAAEIAKSDEQAYVKSMTFDIKPIAATLTDGKLSTEVIPNSAIKSAITFRLPVDANATETMAEVFHNGQSMGNKYQVQGDTEKYIEVSTESFSEFKYQLREATPTITNVAQIGTQGYATLAEAVAAAQNGETITLIADVDITTGGITIAQGKDIILDLNGHNIKTGEQNTNNILVNGKLTLEDNSANHDGKIYTEESYSSAANMGVVRVEGGEFVMNSGNIEAVIEPNPANYGQFGVVMWGGGKTTINEGQIKAGWYAISNNGTDVSAMSIIVNGGELISTTDYSIYQPAKNSALTVNNGVVYGASGAIAANGGTVNVTGGTITSKGQGSTGNWGDGTGGLENAAIIANARYNDVAVTISGGTITAEGNAVTLDNGTTHNVTIAVSGGTFSSEIPEKYCANFFAPVTTPDADGKYTVQDVNMVYTGTNNATNLPIGDAATQFNTIRQTNPNAIMIVKAEKASTQIQKSTNVIVKSGDTYTCEYLELTDGADFATPVDFEATAVANYTRGGNKWGTLCLPYDVVETGDVNYYVIDENEPYTYAGDQAYLKLVHVGELKANTPCLYRKSDDIESSASVIFPISSGSKVKAGGAGSAGTSYQLHGVYTQTTLEQSNYTDKYYFISNNQFWGLDNGAKVNVSPFRAYLTLANAPDVNANVRSFGLMIDDEALTGIEAAEAMEALGLADGKYVENGKIVIVKNGQKYNLNGTK